MKTKFEILDGETVVRTETFTGEILKIGKLQSSALVLDDESVSRMHAVVEVDTRDESVRVLDLGSVVGTLVNGKKVTSCRLQSGDELRFGNVRVRFTIEV
jgi:pSer/pThr/pTyr-binding forkhead associated (FHA) protein